MRKIAICLTVCTLLLASCMFAFTSCDKIVIKDYPAARTSFAYETDESIPLYDPESGYIANQSRGFRGETYINLGTDEAYPGSGESYTERLKAQAEAYADDGITLIQTYVYIGKFYDTDIPQSAFDQLRDYFLLVKDYGFKMLLRFAYETEASEDGPKTKDIERHCAQIKEFVARNEELFDSTVYAVQLGMIGLWAKGTAAYTG